eukprot:TRINITY_DN12559_c0_g1_i1.p2 TRINITY_DN12559_c0_g1~~TRINITY_DN12559_c0_g1_i1.p2  ORF type:complete len:936 (+),score=296.76 TRINITY_DN12559_c0_g1_i1:116-2809(+)
MALVGPGALTPYSGGGRRRSRGTCVVREPACGFFIAGSSLEDMNGIYGRVHRVSTRLKHNVLLAYKHDHSGWFMVLVDRSSEDGADSGKFGDMEREWLLVDETAVDRFSHEGDTIIPGAGTRWTLCGTGRQDDDELPWQVIALLDGGVLQDLRAHYVWRQRKIAAAIAGKDLPNPQGARAGGWMWKVEAPDGVAIRTAPRDSAEWCGQRQQGDLVRGADAKGDWLRLSDSERRRGGDYIEKYMRFLSKVQGERTAAPIDAAELWVRVMEQDGTLLLTRVHDQDAPCLREAPEDPDMEMPHFDRPFEPRLQDGDASSPRHVEPGMDEDSDGADEDTDQATAARQAEVQQWLLAGAPEGDGPLCGHMSTLSVCSGAIGLSTHVAVGVTLQTAECRLAAALRAAQRDACASISVHHAAGEAHEALLAAVRSQLASPRSVAVRARLPSDEAAVPHRAEQPPQEAAPALAPHTALEAGELGSRAAGAARQASSTTSVDDVERGVRLLSEVLADEQRRLSRVGSASGPGGGAEGEDALRIRLTMVRALLRARRDDDALRMAEAAVKQHPGAAAAQLWHGRCLLRVGERAEGVAALTRAAGVGPAAGVDARWAHADATKRLRNARRSERCKLRGDDEYGCGRFAEAARLYGEAISKAESDDKWGRASMHANRAACHRRARALPQAIADCDDALRLFPTYRRALFRRAVCLLEAGRPEEAVTGFEMLLKCDREWPELLDWLIRAHAQLRRLQRGQSAEEAPQADAAGPSLGRHVDHYTALGVSTDASADQLKHAYRIMSLKYHPDRPGGSTQLFQRIAQAYDVLSDPQKRRAYDDGGDIKKDKGDDSSDDEREERSLREEVERKYFPEHFKFWPFGDPHIQKRKHDERKRRSEGGRPSWWGPPTR